ncbi:MAG: DUF3159 domain-containing protein [Galbitalea sp.]
MADSDEPTPDGTVPDITVPDSTVPESTGGQRQPSFSESLAGAARQSGLGQLKPGETPNARTLLAAVGGVRGIVESVLPGIAFLVLYLTTQNLLVSVLVPVGLVFVFVVARAGARSPMSSAIAGGILLAISAVLALVTGHAVTNFLPGMIINAVFLLALLISLAARWPLIGIVVGLLFGDVEGWRRTPASAASSRSRPGSGSGCSPFGSCSRSRCISRTRSPRSGRAAHHERSAVRALPLADLDSRSRRLCRRGGRRGLGSGG